MKKSTIVGAKNIADHLGMGLNEFRNAVTLEALPIFKCGDQLYAKADSLTRWVPGRRPFTDNPRRRRHVALYIWGDRLETEWGAA